LLLMLPAAAARAQLHATRLNPRCLPMIAPAATPCLSACVRRFSWFRSSVTPTAVAAPAAPAVPAPEANIPASAMSHSDVHSEAVSVATAPAVPVHDPTSVAAASGIGWPTDWLEALLSTMHSAAGLPWWMTIACATVIFRSAMVPLVVKQMKNIGQANTRTSLAQSHSQRTR
jgi:hypothetical protein